jgi:hypothetical protein
METADQGRDGQVGCPSIRKRGLHCLNTFTAIDQYAAASSAQRNAWAAAYSKAFDSASIVGGTIKAPTASYGPVGTLMQRLLTMAQGGGLDVAGVNLGRH